MSPEPKKNVLTKHIASQNIGQFAPVRSAVRSNPFTDEVFRVFATLVTFGKDQ